MSRRHNPAGIVMLGLSIAAAPSVGAQPRAAPAPLQQGDRFYCHDRRLGTWFYCERPKTEEPTSPPPAAPPETTAAEKLDAVTIELRELKARAILEPTPENVTAYIRFQRAQLDRASLFGDVWQRALWQAPELDYTLQRPVGTVAKQQWSDARNVERDQALDRIGQRYGLFYFFAQGCGACKIMSPIVKAVADTHHMTVRAISTDGGPSETFPRYTVETNQRATMGLTAKTTPAVVLFDSATRSAIPIASERDLLMSKYVDHVSANMRAEIGEHLTAPTASGLSRPTDTGLEDVRASGGASRSSAPTIEGLSEDRALLDRTRDIRKEVTDAQDAGARLIGQKRHDRDADTRGAVAGPTAEGAERARQWSKPAGRSPPKRD